MLQAVHHYNDDRVFYHQAKTLIEEGHRVEIYDCHSFSQFQPINADIYIVDSPKAIWKIRKIQTKIVYDITEWYPSKKNIRHLRWGKLCKSILLICANLWAGYKADAFIFGERDKAVPFRFLFPKKTAIDLPYYPDLEYIPTSQQRDISKQCKVLYAGPLTKEKGFYRVIETMILVAQQHPEIQWHTTIISGDQHSHTALPENLTTYNVGLISGGTSVNTIAQDARMMYEYRSDNRNCLAKMQDLFEKTVETFRATGVEVEVEKVGDRPCASPVDPERFNALKSRAKKSLREVSEFEYEEKSASTDCNIPLSMGVPAIGFGVVIGRGAHTREERLNKASIKTGSSIFLNFLYQ